MQTKIGILCNKTIEAGWLVAVIVTPLFFDVFTNTVFDPDKITLLRSITLVMLLAWLVGSLEHRAAEAMSSRGGHSSPHGGSLFAHVLTLFRTTPLAVPALLFILVYLLTTLTSILPRTSLWGTYLRLEGAYTILCYTIVFFLVAHNLRTRQQAERLLTAILVASLPVAFFGIMQHYGLDPIPWAHDMAARVGSTLGWPVFAGAYLIMVVPLTLRRLVQTVSQLRVSHEDRVTPLISVGCYGFLLVVQILAILFTQSRGPFLGLLGGVLFFFLVLTAVRRRRALTLLVVSTGIEVLLILAILNLPNTPWASVRDHPALARLSRVFDVQAGTGRWRLRVWSSALDLVADDPARTVVGTGPESLYILFNRVFPEDARAGVTADRSHNETLDTLVRSGLLGLSAYLLLFGSIFYYGLKGLGLINGQRQRRGFLGLLTAGGIVGAAVPWYLQHTMTFVWVGLPIGLLVGMVLYVLIHVFVLADEGSGEGQDTILSYGAAEPRDAWSQMLLAALIAALVAHFIELQFSFGVAVTYLHFWVYAALLAVVARTSETGLPAEEPLRRPEPKRRRRRGRQLSVAPFGLTALRGSDVLVSSVLAGVILMTMGFSFINKQYPLSARSSGVPLLFFATWLFAILVIGTDSQSTSPAPAERPPGFATRNPSTTLRTGSQFAIRGSQTAFLAYTILSLGWFVLFIVSHLLGLSSQRDLATPILLYYLWLFLSIGAVAALLLAREASVAHPSTPSRPVLWGLYLVLVVVVGAIILKTNINIVRADTYYNWGIAYEESGQWDAAVELYRRAIAIAPAQDRYYTFLGGAYGARAVEEGDPDSSLFRETEAALRRARDLSPLDPDHWANLGRLYQSWALLTEEPEPRLARLNAALENYEQATTLSPNNHGRRLKDNVVEIYLMLGDHHLAGGDIDQAAQAYSQALERDSQAVLDKKRQAVKDAPQSAAAHESLALVYAQMDRPEDALDHLRRAVELGTAEEQTALKHLAAFLDARSR